MNDQTRSTVFAFVIAALLSAAGACSNSEPGTREATAQPTPAAARPTPAGESSSAAAPAPAASPAAAEPAATPDLAPPRAEEIRAALARTYAGAVVFDERHVQAVVGDFNGDGSSDVAVVVRPDKAKLDDLNNEFANWTLEDPTKVARPDPRQFDPHQGVQKLTPTKERPRVEAGDVLLAVIHGYEGKGWRNPDARQTYLLKNAVGGEMRTKNGFEAQREIPKTTLRLHGDIIQEKLGGASGFLYWTGAKYGWFH